MAVESLPLRRFRWDEVQQMVRAGILNEDDRLELVNGQLLEMSPINGPHAVATIRLPSLFWRRLGARVDISVQNPVRLSTCPSC